MNQEKKRFETIEHTADVGIVVYGRTPEELYENAAYGMFSLISDTSDIKEIFRISVSIDAHDREELLITFLNELLYYYSTKKIFFKRFEILTLSETHLDANVSGAEISEHEILRDIKSATYHGIRIDKSVPGYKVKIIFDV